MLLGFSLTILMVKFIQIPMAASQFASPVALSLSLFLLPIYDTLRVFFIRFFEGKSPLSPDRNHIHHVMLKLGYNHSQATILLVGYNILSVTSMFLLQSLGELWLIMTMLIITVSIGSILGRKVMRRETNRKARLIDSDIQMTKSA